MESTIDELAAAGHRQVLFAPIGFVSDHVEVLYDVDTLFRRHAEANGLQFARIPMLNASPALVQTLASIIEEHGATGHDLARDLIA